MAFSKAQQREIEAMLDKREKRSKPDKDVADQLLEAATRIISPEPKSKPAKARAAVTGEKSFYERIPSPMRFTCTACGEQRHAIWQEDGLCLRCRWARRSRKRQDGGAA